MSGSFNLSNLHGNPSRVAAVRILFLLNSRGVLKPTYKDALPVNSSSKPSSAARCFFEGDPEMFGKKVREADG